MVGFSSNQFGDAVVFAHNVNFSGDTQHENTMVTDGQLIIAHTALNAGGTHIDIGKLTSPNGTLNISYSNPNITLDVNGNIFHYTNVTHAMSPYQVQSSDYYISVDCSGGIVTLNFPNSTVTNRTWIIKDRTGNASANNISITTLGGVVTIDGQTTYKITSNFGAINLLFNATSYEVY